MAEADTNRVAFAYDKETVFGTAPTGAGVYRYLRYKSDSLVMATSTKKSEEIRSDRNITQVVRTGVEVTGDIACELSKDTGFEELLQSSLQDTSTWTPNSPEDNVVSVATTSTITRAAGDFTTNTNVGDYILLHGWTDAANNRAFRALTVVALTITVDGTPLVVEAAAAGKVFVSGVAIKNEAEAAGTAIDSYSFEKEFTDLTSEFAVYRGCTIGGFTIAHGVDDFVTITFHINGKDEEGPRPTASKDSGTIIAAGTSRQFNAVDDVIAITENNVEYDVTGFSANVNNNHHPRQVAGTLGPKSMGSGTCEVTGNVSMLFSDSTQVDKHIAYTETKLALILFNGTQNAYVIELPSLQFSGGGTLVAGQSQDVIAELPWEAQQETTAIAGETVRAAFRIWKFY